MTSYISVWMNYSEFKDYQRGRKVTGFTTKGKLLINVHVPIQEVVDMEELEECYEVIVKKRDENV